MVTNLLVAVTEIKGDIKLILHQQKTADEQRIQLSNEVSELRGRTDSLETQMTKVETTKHVTDRLFKAFLAVLGAAVGLATLWLQVK